MAIKTARQASKEQMRAVGALLKHTAVRMYKTRPCVVEALVNRTFFTTDLEYLPLKGSMCPHSMALLHTNVDALLQDKIRPVLKHECVVCGCKFSSSRNALFDHIHGSAHVLQPDVACRLLRFGATGEIESAAELMESAGIHKLPPNAHQVINSGLFLTGQMIRNLIVGICNRTAKQLGPHRSSVAFLKRLIESDKRCVPYLTPYRDLVHSTNLNAAAQLHGDRDLLLMLCGLPEDGVGVNVPHCAVCDWEYFFCVQPANTQSPALHTMSKCGCCVCVNSAAGWFKAEAEGGATFTTIRCPVCLGGADITEVTTALRSKSMTAVIDMLEKQSVEAVVSTMPDFSWCPQCESGGFAPEGCKDVHCETCHSHYCVDCKLQWHPVHQSMTCEEYKTSPEGFLSTAAAMDAEYMKKYTRACPKCSIPIQHGGGCSHMSCKQCKYQFCWLCMGDYTPGRYAFQGNDGGFNMNAKSCPCGRPFWVAPI
jgi:hypothetical protein